MHAKDGIWHVIKLFCLPTMRQIMNTNTWIYHEEEVRKYVCFGFFSGFVSLWGGVTYRCLILTKNTWKHIFWKPCHPHNFHEANRQCCRELTGQNMLASWCLGFMSVFLTHVEQVGHTSVGCAGTCRAEVRWWQTSVPVCSWCGLRRWFRQRGRTDRWGWTPGRVGALGTHVHTLMAK